MSERFDVAVVGAGILGLAHAWAAARRGRSVVLFERHPRAQGASVRNFGMVWPIGQPAGELRDCALLSRQRWLELREEAGVWVEPCGSLHVAYEDDEWAVLQEFAASEPAGSLELLAPAEAVRRSPGLQTAGLRGALFSPAECCVDPREAIARVPGYLAERYGVRLRFAMPVRAVDAGRVETAAGEVVHVGHTVICSGIDFETLLPEAFASAGLRVCKLQMMRTAPQPGGWRLGPHLAGGLTLCHYAAFAGCATLPRLRERFERTMPDYIRYGIHVMASQNGKGEVVIGDSHEYGEDVEVFDKAEIDELILAYLRRMLRLPDVAIAARWHGLYAKHPTQPVYTAAPRPGVEVMVAPGGAGMTLSFGLAEAWWRER